MNQKKLVSLILSLSIATSAILSNTVIANADTISPVNYAHSTKYSDNKTLSSSEIQGLKEWFSMYGVGEDVQDKLIEKVNNGQLIDSMKEGIEPINIESIKNESGLYTKFTYPDGSIKIVSDISSLNRDYASVDGGTIVSSSAYHTHLKDVKIYASIGIVSCFYYADLIYNRDAFDKLNDIYDYSISVIGGTYSEVDFGIDRANETSGYPAKGHLAFKYTTYAGTSDFTIRLNVFVGNDNTTAENN